MQNFLLLNLIISELGVSMIAIPLDLFELLMRCLDYGTGNGVMCTLIGFVHTIFGEYKLNQAYIYIYIYRYIYTTLYLVGMWSVRRGCEGDVGVS